MKVIIKAAAQGIFVMMIINCLIDYEIAYDHRAILDLFVAVSCIPVGFCMPDKPKKP